MAGADGNTVVTLNGETYNYQAPRGELEAASLGPRRFAAQIGMAFARLFLPEYEKYRLM
jgi:hypothetical protein